MTTKKENKAAKKITLSVVGSILLVAGTTLILTEWEHVVALFKGVIGMVLALAGLIVLMLIKS